MSLTMDTLNGFMRVGPQVYPARPNAVQVIERGPHGKRLGQDPVTVRLGKPRGSGFRFWVEQLNVPADESWNPPQRVVGLMGMGTPPNASELYNACDSSLPPPPAALLNVPRGRSAGAQSMAKEFENVARAACRGRVGPARQILEGAWRYFGGQMTADERAAYEPALQASRAYISRIESGGQAGAALQRTESRESAFSDRMRAWNEQNADAAMAEERRMNECARGGSLNYAACIAAQDPAGAAQAAVTGRPPARWSQGINTEVGERRARGECVGIAPACWAKKSWKPVLVGAAALVGLYALAGGIGRGLGGR